MTAFRTCLLCMAFLNVGFTLGCCRQSRHVDHRAVVPADPGNVHRLPAWQVSPPTLREQEA